MSCILTADSGSRCVSRLDDEGGLHALGGKVMAPGLGVATTATNVDNELLGGNEVETELEEAMMLDIALVSLILLCTGNQTIVCNHKNLNTLIRPSERLNMVDTRRSYFATHRVGDRRQTKRDRLLCYRAIPGPTYLAKYPFVHMPS